MTDSRWAPELDEALWGKTPRLQDKNGMWFNACPLMVWTTIRMLLWLCDLPVAK